MGEEQEQSAKLRHAHYQLIGLSIAMVLPEGKAPESGANAQSSNVLFGGWRADGPRRAQLVRYHTYRHGRDLGWAVDHDLPEVKDKIRLLKKYVRKTAAQRGWATRCRKPEFHMMVKVFQSQAPALGNPYGMHIFQYNHKINISYKYMIWI